MSKGFWKRGLTKVVMVRKRALIKPEIHPIFCSEVEEENWGLVLPKEKKRKEGRSDRFGIHTNWHLFFL